MYDMTMVNIARQEYEERLAWAERQRRLRRAARYEPTVLDQLLASLGRKLVGAGARLQQRVEMRPRLS